MAKEEKESAPGKISPAFASRLGRLGPRDEVRAIVMLRTGGAGLNHVRRRGSVGRRSAVESVRRALADALPDIDRILKRHRGKRLRNEVDALGAVPVVTTAAGINALTTSEHVKAIFEDQKIHGLP